MGGVGAQRDMDVTAGGMSGAIHREAKVVLDVARSQKLPLRIRSDCALHELVQHFLKGLAHHVGKHVKTTTVRHPNVDRLDSERHGRVDAGLHPRDKRVHALEPEALRRVVLGRQERLEVDGVDQTVQEAQGGLLVVLELLGVLELSADPVLLLHVRDVRELHPHRVAVRRVHDLNDISERAACAASDQPTLPAAHTRVQKELLL
mmetsp:Transcript_43142/g.105527  ORF Transcript_43142/g.105527 Transcript_43142/m.105527 type:complete len:205 (-) Transcript_43142:689-1303(-)